MHDTRCPKCSSPLTLNPDTGMFRCVTCGFKRPETLDEASARIRSRGERPVVTLTQRGEIDLRARTLFENGQDALWRGDKAAAIREFEEAADVQPDFVDAHLWIAKTSDDARLQRDHLDSILAHDPGHVEALRLLLVLNGDLTPEEAQRSRETHTPILRRAADAVQTNITTLRCPVCGGDLTTDENNGRVVCRSCGHSEPLDASRHASDGAAVLGAALLKRRAQSERWIVGER
ncbi:MAG: Trm112 family protein, partial [Chloroflexota bacterium]